MNKNKKIVLVAAVIAVMAVLIAVVNITKKPESGRINDTSVKTEEKQDHKTEETKNASTNNDAESTTKAEKKTDGKTAEKAAPAEEKAVNQSAEESEPAEKVTPTFMYFVSKSDADYAAGLSAVESLKKEYGDKVKFEIADIDEKPELKDNFQLVVGQTPALIMLNTSNDISALEFKCTDTDTLKKDIENALK